MLAALKAAAKAAFKVIQNAPIGGILKVGLLIGSVIFAAWVLIKRAQKMHEAANAENQEYYSPVDEILGKKNYTNNVEDFDDMDPLAREICHKLNKMGRGKKRKKRKGVKVSKKRSIHDIFDGDFGAPLKTRPSADNDKNVRIVSLFDDGYDPADDEDDAEDAAKSVKERPKSRIGGMDAATEMLIRQEIKREKKRMKEKKAAARMAREDDEFMPQRAPRKKKLPVLSKEGLAEVSRILDIWHKYGEERKDELVGRLQKIANDLGLKSIDDLDDVVARSVREVHPNLF